jgi:hypothetical protein
MVLPYLNDFLYILVLMVYMFDIFEYNGLILNIKSLSHFQIY